MTIPIKNFIRDKATFHSEMTYDETRICFNIKPYRSTETGIYFILDGEDILKVGKAEGKQGLAGRIGSYRSSQITRLSNDRTTQLLFNTMTKSHKGKTLSLYVFEIKMIETIFEGYPVKTSLVRSFEETLSRQARSEGHSMVLSGQD